jgi:hypothetical protein
MTSGRRCRGRAEFVGQRLGEGMPTVSGRKTLATVTPASRKPRGGGDRHTPS